MTLDGARVICASFAALGALNTGGTTMASRTVLRNMAIVLLGVWLLVYMAIWIPWGPVRAWGISGFGVVSAGVVATALVTFFGFLSTGDTRTGIPDGNLRSAIAASTVVTYLVFVGTAGLFQTTESLSEISRLFLTSFTATVSVIIAFYFGSSAYVAARTGTEKKGPD
jgi:hypothetical protein